MENKITDSKTQQEELMYIMKKIEEDRRLVEFSSKSQGLGDTIAKITSTIGITPCGGCKKRQETLNRLFPYSVTEESE